MRRITLVPLALVLVAFAVSVMGADSCGSSSDEGSTKQESGGGSSSGGSESPPAKKATADTSTRCDYLLGDFTEGSDSGFRFVGSLKVTNTGNVGLVVRGKASWEQLGAAPITQTKKFRVRRGHSRTVQFKVLATQNQIDAHQSADGDCKVKAKIIDTFGTPSG